ncbi:hypothetical protein CN271_22440 [Bacillus cereus]|uniref:replication-relaxation family protein n=1 Tax=Bacillus cereus TaxID=1396 RepID=UPI000BEC9BE0|nr:replication-relaxation family protein [Bacillus cereus]PEE33444.1 hypothetical protein CON59_25525 [Bacillus cereus]PET44259.1 hypothetical protein CN523_19965 [Bacillus cereus]PFA54475.1 hypothetical protein CN389_19305 [Bacillus cereus]PFD66481.1 hypothetical protein CN271_22440 [Bacillus cereus]PFE77250.1 hypothetical protein CN319_13855 [Bacillus cereus]
MYNFKKITERDKEVLTWISRHSYVTATQVEKLFGVSRQIAYRILRRLKDYGFLKNDLVLRNLGLFYATEEGIEIAEIDLNPIQKVGNLSEIRHELMIVDLEVELLIQDKVQGVISEWITTREIKRERYKNAEKIQSENLKHGKLVKGQKDDVPDAYWLREGNKAAIEVELSRKHKDRIKEKLKTYDTELATGRLQAVMYFTDRQAIKNLLESQRGVMVNKSLLFIRDFPEVGE